ncbi:MAG: hypothetical protein ABSC06_10845 [Rhodopila sp.]|jgi:hypothetical protein
MAAIAADHLRRMLDHHEKIAAEQRDSNPKPVDPQLKMPLIGEARRLEPPMPKRGRPRTKKPIQLKLGD